MSILQKRIEELRSENELTQKQLAKKIGVSETAISFWENGVNEPKASYLNKLAQCFNVTTDYLLGLEDEFGTPIFSPEEKSAGLSATKKVSITPIEEDMLEVFRKVGKKHGESAQQAIITVAEKML